MVWRWPADRWEWLRAGAWIWSANSVATVATAFGMAVGAGMMTNAYLIRENTADAGAMLFGASIGLLIGAGLVLGPASILYVIGCLFVPRLMVTGQEVYVESHVPWRRSRTVPRSEVLATEIYEGDGTVLLMNNSGSTLRVRHVGKAAAFAEALGAPTLAWPVREPTRAVEWLIMAHLVVISFMPFVTMTMALVLINMIAGESVGYLPRVFSALTGGAIVAVLLMPLGLIPVLAIGRRFASPQTLDEFIARGRDLARWQGRRPSWWRWPDNTFADCTRIAIRILRITPPPPLEPELRHGATKEMAATLARVSCANYTPGQAVGSDISREAER